MRSQRCKERENENENESENGSESLRARRSFSQSPKCNEGDSAGGS